MEQFFQQNIAWIAVLVALWTLPWKGIALWRAAQNSHKAWFVIFLILNDLAILEILYIYVFSKRKGRGQPTTPSLPS